MEAHKVTHALEDYLKAIYQLAEEAQPVIAARIAAETGVTPSTMFATLRRLASEGYVTINRRKEIHLTEDGRKVAERIVRRHFLTERFLTDLLGLDWVKAHQEAHRLEHAISQEVEERLAKLLSNPTTCPHGNPIPGTGSGRLPKTVPLSEAVDGQQVDLDYITEGGERDVRLLGYSRGSRTGARRQSTYYRCCAVPRHDDAESRRRSVFSRHRGGEEDPRSLNFVAESSVRTCLLGILSGCRFRLCLGSKAGQFVGEKLDLIAERNIPVDDDQLLSFDPAAPAMGAVADFAQKLLHAHMNIQLFGADDEILEAGFLTILRSLHLSNFPKADRSIS